VSGFVPCIMTPHCAWNPKACACDWRCEYRGDSKDSCESNSFCEWQEAYSLCGYPKWNTFSGSCDYPGLSAGAIAGAVIGSLVGAALIGGLIWWCVVKRRAGDAHKTFESPGKSGASDGFMTYNPDAAAAQQMQVQQQQAASQQPYVAMPPPAMTPTA
jgi:hypothetical protein